MKKILLLIPLLYAFKCATREVNIIIENKTHPKYYLTSTKDIKMIKKYLLSDAIDEVRVINVNKKIVKPLFLEVSLDIYESNNKYVFYLINQNDFNQKRYNFDSISISKENFNNKKENIIIIDGVKNRFEI